jgi:hypothetical protein
MKGGITMPKRKTIGKKRLTRVSVEAETRDEIDWDRYAWALLQYCRILIEDKESSNP